MCGRYDREKKAKAEVSEIENMRTDIENRSSKIEAVLKSARKDSVAISEKIIKQKGLLNFLILQYWLEQMNND